MRFQFAYAALGLAAVIGAPAAQAQTVITTQPAPAVLAEPPLVTAPAATVVQPAETIRTTRTVRTVRTFVPVRHQIVTTTTVRRRVMPAETTGVAPTVAAAPVAQPLYDVAPAVVATPATDIYAPPTYGYGYDYGYRAPPNDYSAPLYDIAPAATLAPAPVVAAPVATAPVIYRYVYEPDRILVIDPTTNIAVQAIPR
jgi:hypothetical protein